MRKEAWKMIRICAASLAAFCFASRAATAESGLSDEGEGNAETAIASEIEVPRTEEAMKLAQQVIGKLRESYYSLKGTGTGAFEASFTVKEGALTVGTLKASWDAKKASVSTEFSGKPGYPNADWLEQLSWAALSESLSRSFVPRGLYGAQTDDGYVIADYSVDPSEAKSVRSFVSTDLLQIRKIIRLPDDQEKETIWQAKESGGKNYLASMTIIGRIPDEPERKVSFALTYTARYGPPFVRKLTIEDTGFGTKGSWVLEMDKVAFTKAESSGEEVPQTQEAKDLAREVLTKLNESHYSLLQTNLDGFQATFAVQKDGEAAGELMVGWNRTDGQIATAVNAEGLEKFQDWLRGAMEWCMRMTVLSWTSPEEDYAIYAARKGNTYLMDASEDPSVESKTMLVSEDFCLLRDVLRYDDGFELDGEYTVETADGKHFVKSMKRTARQPEAEEIKNEFTLTYVRREGFPFIKRVLLDNIEPGGKTSWALELKEVAFHRGAVPEPEVTEATTVAQAPTPSPEPTKPEPTPEPTKYPELFDVNMDGEGGYVDKNGEIVIPFDFDTAYPFSEGLASVRMGDKFGYIDHTGEIVILPQFENVEPFREGVALVRIKDKEYRFIDRTGQFIAEGILATGQGIGSRGFSEGLTTIYIDGKWGYADKKGKAVIRPQFSDAGAFSGGLAPVAIGEHKWGYIDPKGKSIIRPQFHWARPFSEGLARVQLGEASGYKFGYIDGTGKMVIQPAFDDAEAFSEGLARVSVQQKWGYISKTGKWAIQPAFDRAGNFSGGLAPVKAGEKWGYVDKTGKLVVKPQYDFAVEFSGSLASVESGGRWLKIDRTGKVIWDPLTRIMGKALYPVVMNGRWGYIDRLGKVVVGAKFEAAGPFSEGLGPVKSAGKWGYVDLSGKTVVEPQFDEAYSLAEGLAPVKVGDKYGFVDKTGKMAIKAQFEDVWNFAEGFAPVKLNGKIGFIDKAGKMVVEPKFDSTYGFSENVAAVKLGEKWGFMNKAGAMYIEPQFQNVWSFGGGLAPVTTDGKKWGFIHVTGTMLIEPQFGYAFSFSEGLAPVMIGEKYGYIDKHGEQVIPPLFEWAGEHSEGWAVVEAEVKGETEVFFVSKNPLRRLIEAKGEKWDRAWAFKDGLAKIQVGDKIGYINKTGQFIWEPRE